MKNKIIVLLALLFAGVSAYAQLGIRVGVNMANEIRSFNNEDIKAAFKSDNLTGYQVGLVYEFNPQKTGFGCEFGALLSQKGGVFKFDSTGVVNSFVKGYQQMNYVEVPFNVKYRLQLGPIGVYGIGGIYGAYALNGKTVFEAGAFAGLEQAQNFNDFMDHIDYGYSYGAGIELIRKLQIAASWSQGLQKKDANKGFLETVNNSPNLTSTSTSKVFSVSVTYLF